MQLLETQKGTHNGLDGVLTVLCLTEDDRSVGLKALVGNLETLGDDLAMKVVLALVEEHLANTVIRVGQREAHACRRCRDCWCACTARW